MSWSQLTRTKCVFDQQSPRPVNDYRNNCRFKGTTPWPYHTYRIHKRIRQSIIRTPWTWLTQRISAVAKYWCTVCDLDVLLRQSLPWLLLIERLTDPSAIRPAIPDGGIRQRLALRCDTPAARSGGTCACALHSRVAAISTTSRNIRRPHPALRVQRVA